MSDLETVKIRPHNDRVLIQRKKEEHKGRIIMPEMAQKMSMEGEVLAVGPACVDVKPGDNVFFGQYSFTEFKREGARIIVRESDILAVYERE